MAREPEYMKMRITGQIDPKTGQFDIKNLERDIRSMLNNAVKSSLAEGEYFRLSPKSLTPQGQYTADLYVHADSALLTHKTMNQQLQEMTFKGSNIPKYDISQPDKVSGRVTRVLRKEEREAQEGAETETTRFHKGAWIKVIGLLTTIAGITRRILSSVLAFSQQTAKDMITAHNLGMSYESVRNYRHVEATHGMREGTITEAIADIQGKFGNITSLDENALNALAVVMGNGIKEMVDMGLGASNPEKVVGAIVDAFNEKAYAGYNSVGQYVGEQQARRELYSYLLKISPKVADIFATMQEEQRNINSIFRGKLDTYEDFKSSATPPRYNNTPANYNVVATTGQEWNVVKDIYNQILEGIKVELAPEILNVLRRLSNIRWGLSEKENIALDEEHRQANAEYIQSAKAQLSLLSDTEADRQRKLALNYYIKKLEKENEKQHTVADLVPTPDEIVVKGQQLAEDAIRFSLVDIKNTEYSPEMQTVVDRYVPKDKLNAYRTKFQSKLDKAKEDEIEKRTNELYLEKQNDPAFQAELDRVAQENASEIKKHSGRWSGDSGARAVAVIKAKGIYADRRDLWYDSKGKELPLYQQFDNAVQAGLIKSSGGVTPNYSVINAVTEQEKKDIRNEVNADKAWQNEGFYKDAYTHFANFYQLSGHLADLLIGNTLERITEGTPLYDLDVLQREFGADLSGLANLVTKDTWGSIISKTSEDEGSQIIHRIILDVKADGKESNDIELMSYITNRISDTGTVVKQASVKNGNVYINAVADSMSNY